MTDGNRELAEVLDAITALLLRFVVFANVYQPNTLALWAVHTWLLGAFDITPYICLSSPEQRAGKTRVLEAMGLVVKQPWQTVLPSEAVLYRKIAQDRPTLLLDETDAIFTGKETPRAEMLRALLDAGNKRGAMVPRCVAQGKGFTLVEFDVYCPKAFAGIGELPRTIADRAIIIRLQRKLTAERVERLRSRNEPTEANRIRRALEKLSADTALVERLKTATPDLPPALNDRAADAWEPLLAIADEAGGGWPAGARAAALVLSGAGSVQEERPGALLLADLRTIFAAHGNAEKLSTRDILRALVLGEGLGHEELPERPWPEWWRADLIAGNERGPANKMARLLGEYGVRPKVLRVRTGSTRGYLRAPLEAAWERYAPAPEEAEEEPQPEASAGAVTAETPKQTLQRNTAGQRPDSGLKRSSAKQQERCSDQDGYLVTSETADLPKRRDGGTAEEGLPADLAAAVERIRRADLAPKPADEPGAGRRTR